MAKPTIWRMKFKCSKCYTVRDTKCAVLASNMDIVAEFENRPCHVCGSDAGDWTGEGEDTGDEYDAE